jgi:hypothetical protein
MGDDRGAVIRDDHDVHAVFEPEMIDPRSRMRALPRLDRRRRLRRA